MKADVFSVPFTVRRKMQDTMKKLICRYLDEDADHLRDRLDHKQHEKHHHDELSEPASGLN